MKTLTDGFVLENGVKIPCVGFGTWQMPDGTTTENAVREAIEAGYRHIDTAAVYGNEVSVGRAIRSAGVARERLFITTKLWNTEHDYDAALKAFDASMNRLGIEYCDLYLIHWPAPAAVRSNWELRNKEVWRAMEKLYRDGRIRAIGLSNFWPHHIEALLHSAEIRPMVNQLRINPTDLHQDVAEYSQKEGMLVEAYSPLGTGQALSLPEITTIAEKHGKSAAQVCLRWCLQKGYLPLPKSVTPERIQQNKDLFDFELDVEDMSYMDTLDGRFGISNHPDKVSF